MARLLLLLVLALPLTAIAAIDAYPFPDDTLRDRYNQLIDELRCPQCINTNLAGSDAMIAQDLRREVHRLLLEGRSDEEILDFMHTRYGDFILYEPRLTPRTLFLWFAPLVLLAIALSVIARVVFIRRGDASADLDDDDRKRLQQLLDRR